jgi:hypothetical protein
MFGYDQNHFYPSPSPGGNRKIHRRRSIPEQETNVLQEIGSVAAVLHEAGLLTDPDVMRQFQEFAVGMLNNRTKEKSRVLSAEIAQAQTSAGAAF